MPPVILFDGDCALCNASVRWVLRWEREPLYRFSALQSPAAQRLLQPFGVESVDLSSVLVVDAGQLYRKTDAVLHLMRDMRGFWFLLRAFVGIPRPLRDAVYDFVGRRRYRWWGSAKQCVLAQTGLESRVLVD